MHALYWPCNSHKINKWQTAYCEVSHAYIHKIQRTHRRTHTHTCHSSFVSDQMWCVYFYKFRWGRCSYQIYLLLWWFCRGNEKRVLFLHITMLNSFPYFFFNHKDSKKDYFTFIIIVTFIAAKIVVSFADNWTMQLNTAEETISNIRI